MEAVRAACDHILVAVCHMCVHTEGPPTQLTHNIEKKMKKKKKQRQQAEWISHCHFSVVHCNVNHVVGLRHLSKLAVDVCEHAVN